MKEAFLPRELQRLLVWLLALAGVLVAIYVAFELADDSVPGGLQSRFDLDAEGTLPAWYSSILLFCVALSALAVDRSGTAGSSWVTSRFWMVMAAVFLFLSVDEGAQVHEMLDEATPVKWIFVYAPLAAAFAAYVAWYLAAVRGLSDVVSKMILLGLILLAAGALGAEAVDHFFAPLSEPAQLTEIAIEEGLEMVGTSVILIGCLIVARSRDVTVAQLLSSIR